MFKVFLDFISYFYISNENFGIKIKIAFLIKYCIIILT